MKKIYSILFAVFVTASSALAQTVAITANGGTSGNAIVGGSTHHVTEAIYLDAEIGASNFVGAGNGISRIAFQTTTSSSATFPAVVPGYMIYMKEVPAATTTFTTGTYSLTGYTLVYSGSITFPGIETWATINLTTPFVRTTGNNLQILVVRTGTAAIPGIAIFTAGGNSTSSAANSSRRYNSTTAPAENSTSLSITTFRPGIQLIKPAANEAGISGLNAPTISCNTAANFTVTLINNGTAAIPAAGASITLTSSGANTITPITLSNSASVAPNASVAINFSNVNIGSTTGSTTYRAVLTYSGDGSASNDTARSTGLTTSSLNSFPQTETVDAALPVFSSIQIVSGGRQLWGLRNGAYKNDNLTDSLRAFSGTGFFIADNYSGTSSLGFRSRLISNCLQLPTQTGGVNYSLQFQSSKDDSYATDADSLLVMVSTDRGVTWTRIGGVGRYDASFTTPGWAATNISLAAYAGQTIQIGFDAVSAYGNVIGLDQIVVTANASLPVTLTKFTGERKGTVNQLSWTTSTEINNAGFEIQKSANGINFSKVAYVASKAVNGNSSLTNYYSLDDAQPFAGTNYYRLKQIDRDGKIAYSATVTINGTKVANITINSIFPNPAINVVNIAMAAPKNGTVSLTVVDLAGKVVTATTKSIMQGDNNLQIDVATLPAGTYLLKATDSQNGVTTSKQFVKQ